MSALVASLTYLFFYGVHYFITKGYDNNVDYKINKKSISIKDIIKTVLTNTQLIAVMVYDLLKLIPFYMIKERYNYSICNNKL